jgi:DNA-binding winged helix-turn-helix (wHTH) protein
MQPATRSEGILRFDVFELNLRAGELYKSGRKIRLQEQPFRILATLLQHAGQVVTREELRERLWPEDTFVDFDHSLNTAVKKLRRALNDEADKPRFVETLPRRGYRFLGSVGEILSGAEPPTTPAADLVGRVFLLRGESGSHFLLAPVDETTLQEKVKLEAANDHLGISLLSASGKVLLVPEGTRVKVLEARPTHCGYEARILEGEYFGDTIFVQRKYLSESE